MTRCIGLTGYMGSGKGEIVKLLNEHGYTYISLSDMVRAEATKRGLEHTRENLQNVGNDLRAKGGAGVLGMKVRETIEKESAKQWVIDGIRNPAEAEELRRLPDFHMIGVTADPEVIVSRLTARKREGSSLSKEQILERLEKEKGVGEPPEGQQVKKCLELVDFLIINEGTLEELAKKLTHFLRLLDGSDRPSFDEVFMEIAYTWAQRATCLRRKVGAVIAKDKQQLTAGYNGAPKGVPHCAEMGGCLREKLKIPSGQRHEMCRGTHAEQNAITQAAKLGISIEGGTLYTNTFPCVICTKMILNAGITTVIYDSDYDDPLSKEILGQQIGLKLIRYEGRKFH
ncbi:MAG: AAA family ATPase [Candidatus Peribacteraceae bacterium]|nr:AAA family ATPase [Candidatus Peribacteraceae bacterium]MDD5074447.1 AAA family ATPase [Candidatus Peribacteraceae bacterium]